MGLHYNQWTIIGDSLVTSDPSVTDRDKDWASVATGTSVSEALPTLASLATQEARPISIQVNNDVYTIDGSSDIGSPELATEGLMQAAQSFRDTQREALLAQTDAGVPIGDIDRSLIPQGPSHFSWPPALQTPLIS